MYNDGIFRRQEARKTSYRIKKRPDQGIAERKDNEEIVPTGSPDDADGFEVVSARSNENDEGIKDDSVADDNVDQLGDGQRGTDTKDSKYFEIPLDALKSDQTGLFPIIGDVEPQTGESVTGYESKRESRDDATEIMSHST